MWPVLAEFRSANSEASWQKKKKKKTEEKKLKSADDYVGRPNDLR